MTRGIEVRDPISGNMVRLSVKGFLRGALVGDDPTVAIVLSSRQGELLGHFEADPENAQIFAEYTRQEAELASIAQEETQA